MLRGETKVELTDLCFRGMSAELRYVEKWRKLLPRRVQLRSAPTQPKNMFKQETHHSIILPKNLCFLDNNLILAGRAWGWLAENLHASQEKMETKLVKKKEKQKQRSPCHYDFEYLHLLDSICLRGLDVLSQGSTKRVKGHTPPLWVCEDKEHP